MRKRFVLFLMIFILICLSLTACESEQKDDESGQQNSNMINIGDFEIESNLKNSYEYEFTEFYLGDKSYMTIAGREMPYKVRGIMGVPVGKGPFPVVLITHGSHENLDETKRFDTGFDYLVKALAQNGYIAISMDMIMPYIWAYGDGDDAEKSVAVADEHIKNIILAGSGKALYPIDLNGRVDADKIALIGHSRGGESIYLIAEDQREKGVNIETLLPIAPAWETLNVFPDVSDAILVPQYDGDVARLDGIALYDYLVNTTAGDHSVTFLLGANHNFFNRNIEKDDSLAHEVKNGHPPLLREEQEDFITHFAIDFFDASFQIEDRFYQMSQPQPNKMYGQDVSRQIHLSHTIDLMDPSTAEAFSSDTAKVRHVVDSFYIHEDDILIDTVTIGLLDEYMNQVNLNRDLISIEWDKKGSSVKMIPLVSDLSNNSVLSIDLIPDSASAKNKANTAMRFNVTLRDTKGNIAAVTTAANQNILTCYPGKLGETDLIDSIIQYWTPSTPLGMLNIPLELFKDISLSDIESVELSFEHTDSGALFIGSFRVQ